MRRALVEIKCMLFVPTRRSKDARVFHLNTTTFTGRPVGGMAALVGKLKLLINPPGDANSKLRSSILRRQQLINRLALLLPYIRTALILAGFCYLLALPSEQLGRGHYVSENALQPSQVNTYWSWADVHIADLYADDVDKWVQQNLTSRERAEVLRDAFQTLGLPAATQDYTFFTSSSADWSGANAYSILQAPKTDGAEALVLGASWLSRALDEDGKPRVNVRGVAIVLALANYLKKYSMWSKDIIFLVSDGYVDGAQAWLDSYHGYGQTNLKADDLSLTTGPIWASLLLDYPHHSFSHVGMFYEGANAHLPNLDFINSASHILKHTGIPVVLHSDVDTTLPAVFDKIPFAKKYYTAGKALMYQLSLGALGKAPGPEGVFGRYRIDALTFFGIPAEGPHGFHALGRATESMFRSLNNLLERFHQSFFLYLMTSVDTFISVGNYLAAPILVSAGMTITGLMIWSRTVGSLPGQSKGVSQALAVIGVTHLLGAALFAIVMKWDARIMPITNLSYFVALLLFVTPVMISRTLLTTPATYAPTTSSALRCFTLILAGLLIAIASTLNFGLATALAIHLCAPMMLSRPGAVQAQHVLLTLASPPALWAIWTLLQRDQASGWWKNMHTDWDIVGTHGVMVMWVGIVPLLLQMAVVGLLP